jgi:hypothetical protein
LGHALDHPESLEPAVSLDPKRLLDGLGYTLQESRRVGATQLQRLGTPKELEVEVGFRSRNMEDLVSHRHPTRAVAEQIEIRGPLDLSSIVGE